MKKFKYVIVFQEPYSRTDLPRAELLALMELFNDNVTYDIIDMNKLNKELQKNKILLKHEEKDNYNTNGFITFTDELIKDHHVELHAKIIFLEQCAIIYTNYELDLLNIIKRAGYIHSGGDEIFLAEWGSLKIDLITNFLKNYSLTERAFFPLNFYTKSEEDHKNEKLDKLLIDGSRYHIGSSSFLTAKHQIEKEYETEMENNHIERMGDGCFVFFKDSLNGESSDSLGDLYSERNIIEFAICYKSRYKKDNPIHILDNLKEAKPFWGGIFTTPHRLINCMLNLARVKQGHYVVDPFCHTGTVAIEASQIGCDVFCSDIAESQGAKDNYDFLCGGAQNFNNMVDKLNEIIDDASLHRDFYNLASDSATINIHGQPEVKDEMHIDKLMQRLADNKFNLKQLEHRIFFYIVRRYELEKMRGSITNSRDGAHKVKQYLGFDEKGELGMGYILAGKMLKAYEDCPDSTPLINSNNDKFGEIFTDNKYTSARIGYLANNSNRVGFKKNNILEDISLYGIADNSIDAVVTDPPYGYGEDLNLEQVEAIYLNLFEKSFRWLKSGGYLVFCTLDKVKTGRTQGLLFTEDIIKLANRVAKNCKISFINRNIYPFNKGIYYIHYWKSKYALNRAIIVLKIYKEAL